MLKTNDEIKKDWLKVTTLGIEKSIQDCYNIRISNRYSEDIVTLVTNTELLLLNILKERRLFI